MPTTLLHCIGMSLFCFFSTYCSFHAAILFPYLAIMLDILPKIYLFCSAITHNTIMGSSSYMHSEESFTTSPVCCG